MRCLFAEAWDPNARIEWAGDSLTRSWPLLRCPLLPGVNDTDSHLRGIARMTRNYPKIESVQFACQPPAARCHALELGGAFAPPGVKLATAVDIKRWTAKLREHGCTHRVWMK